MNKTIAVTEKTRNELNSIKYDLGKKSLDETIKHLMQLLRKEGRK